MQKIVTFLFVTLLFGSPTSQLSAMQNRGSFAALPDELIIHIVFPSNQYKDSITGLMVCAGLLPASRFFNNLLAEQAQKLRKLIAITNAYNQDGYTPLLDAVIAEDITQVRELIDNGADLDKVHMTRLSDPLHCAIACRNLTIASLLLDYGATTSNKKLSGSQSALHWTVSCEAFPIAELLLRYRADIDEIDRSTQQSPLHYAITSHNKKAVVFLLEHGADQNKLNKYGKTALQLAYENADGDIIKLLEDDAQLSTKK